MPSRHRQINRIRQKKPKLRSVYTDSEHPNLQLRGQTWYAIMPVPRDAQQRIGSGNKRKSLFVASLETDSKIEAAERLPACISRWNSEIAKARRTDRDDRAAIADGPFGWVDVVT